MPKIYPDGTQHLQLRIESSLMDKLRYIADYNARSANGQIEFLVKQEIARFEKENGPIDFK